MASDKAKIDRLKDLETQHQWRAVLALSDAFSGNSGAQRGHLDWTMVAEAAYHAGAAKASFDARNIFE
jgi:hypothetical protein